jgi:hypothetical protein
MAAVEVTGCATGNSSESPAFTAQIVDILPLALLNVSDFEIAGELSMDPPLYVSEYCGALANCVSVFV